MEREVRGVKIGSKKGFLLSLDAIVAVGILLTLGTFMIGLGFTYSSVELRYQRLYSAGKDMLHVFENAKMSSIQGLPVVQQYLASGVLVPSDMERTILDLIGSFWATGNQTWEGYAEGLAGAVLNATIPGKFNYQLLIDDINVYNKSDISNADYVTRFSTVVSGYTHGEPVSGYMARIYITQAAKTVSSYAYFGGYVGDGNLTRFIELPDFDTVIEAYMEMNTGSDFGLHINGNEAGTYAMGSGGGGENMTADKWVICNSSVNPSYCQNYFQSGQNEIKINFTSNESMYIGGGYIRVRFNTSEMNTVPIESLGQNATQRYWFPGIHGIINLFSSFYVPGELSSMEAYIHYRSNYTTYLTIGNVTIFNNSATGEQVINITNSTFFGLLNYDELSQSTIPIHMSIENISHALVGEGTGDAVLVTDVSGSMGSELGCVDYDIPYICNYDCIFGGSKRCQVSDPSDCAGNICGGFCFIPYNHYLDCNITKLDIAKEADKLFVNIVLNVSGNRIGLVSYATSLESSMGLTDNKTALEYEINGYMTVEYTCVSCGINEAVSILTTQSNESRRRNILVMSDGEANRCYPGQTCSQAEAKQEAIDEACNAYQTYNITVDAVGFGDDADETTLQAIAACGHGSYYFSNVTALAETYREIAEQWLNATYFAQTIMVYGNLSLNNMLYPDSYIMFNYTSPLDPFEYGEISLNIESPRLNESTGTDLITDNTTGTKEGWYFVPANTEVVDAKITSYSSRYWTDRLYVKNEDINWTRIYWLGNFGDSYLPLGDPYIIHIPAAYVEPGQNNSVRIGTGLAPANATGGSPDDRILYTLRISGITLTGYNGQVFPKAAGCRRTVWYDMDQDNIADSYVFLSVGSDPDDGFDPEEDAVDNALMRLLDGLNFISDANPNDYGNGTVENPYDGSQDNPIDLQITSDVQFDYGFLENIPTLWGPAVLEMRIWT